MYVVGDNVFIATTADGRRVAVPISKAKTASFNVTTAYDDVLKCTLVGDVDPSPATYWVAKPYLLRKASYSTLSEYTYVSKNERDVDNSSRKWTETIIPEYTSGDIIIAALVSFNALDSTQDQIWCNDSGETQTGPGGDPPTNNKVEWAELEGGSRIWEEESDYNPDESFIIDHQTSPEADTNVWDRETPPDTAKSGVVIEVTVGAPFWHAEDQRFYAYTRQLGFDQMGNLEKISEETRIQPLPLRRKYVASSTIGNAAVTPYDPDTGVLEAQENPMYVLMEEIEGQVEDVIYNLFTAKDQPFVESSSYDSGTKAFTNNLAVKRVLDTGTPAPAPHIVFETYEC